jgi:phospholipase/lecithinase/hemolysin
MCCGAVFAGEPPRFTRLVVFGDSGSDNGNFYRLFGRPESPPHYLGRASNGPVWVEHLAERLGLALDDRAIIGATTGEGSVSADGPLGFLAQVRELAAAGAADPDALYVVWIGVNDFDVVNQDPDFDPVDAITIIENAMRNTAEGISTLASLGARQFLVLNLPDLGRLPRVLEEMSPQKTRLATTGALIFNINLDQLLDGIEASSGITIHRFDVFEFVSQVLEAPEAYGFTDVRTRCLTADGAVCANPDEHVFWDGIHPSARAHALLGTSVFEWLSTQSPDGGGDPQGAAPGFVRGDTNGDSRVEISDVIAILIHLFAGAQARCVDAYDADDSGDVNISDAVRLLYFLALGGESPASPYPECGPDPTPDGLSCAAPACGADGEPGTPGSAFVRVTITEPQHGSFTTDLLLGDGGTVRVAGTVDSDSMDDVQLIVNGVQVFPAPDGSFETMVGLAADEVNFPILAEVLNARGEAVARDRVVVVQGSRLPDGARVEDAVAAHLSERGLSRIQAEVDHQLLQRLNLAAALNGVGVSGQWGPFGGAIFATGAGFSCHSLELSPGGDHVTATIFVYDVFVNFHIRGSINLGPLDIDLDCDARLYSNFFQAEADLRLTPVPGRPGEVDVKQVGPIRWILSRLFVDLSGNVICDEDLVERVGDLIGVEFHPLVEQIVRNAIQSFLDPFPFRPGTLADTELSERLQSAIAKIRLAARAGDALGIRVEGDIGEISLQGGIAVTIDASTDATLTVAAVGEGSLDVPRTRPVWTGLSPVDGRPYSFQVTFSLSTLNQYLKALADAGALSRTLREVDLGGGSQPLTAGLLAALFPSLGELDPGTPLAMRISPTLPPMLFDTPTPAGGMVDVVLSHLVAELVVEERGQPEGNVLFAAAIDARAGLDFGFSPSRGEFEVSLVGLSPATTRVTLLKNSSRVPDLVVETVLGLVAVQGIGGFEEQLRSFQVPRLPGMSFGRTTVAKQGGYICLYTDLVPDHGRPDLVVTRIESPPVVDRNLPFSVDVWIKNQGSVRVRAPVQVGFSFSLDNFLFNGNDGGLGSFVVFMALGPDEERRFTFTLGPAPWAAFQPQRLFACVDLPAPPFFSFAGVICESAEANNWNSVGVLASASDARIEDVEVPADLIGGIGPRCFRVTVSRSDLDPPGILFVPVRVVVGIPNHPQTRWGDQVVGLRPGQRETVCVWVPTPPAFGNCGDRVPFPVLACANLFEDRNRTNDCARATAMIAVPYWDLRYRIVNAPSSASQGSTIGWDVEVENAGIVLSDAVCAITGIVADPGAGVWGRSLGTIPFNLGQIPAGQTRTFRVRNYIIWNDALRQTQYIKAEIQYTDAQGRPTGCHDDCLAGNFHQRSIGIR